MNLHSLAQFSFLVALLVLGWTDEAHAYIDPGTASIFLQALVAAIVGGMVLTKTYWIKFKMLFSKKKENGPATKNNQHSE